MIDNKVWVSTLLHLVLLLVQQSQTSCYVTGDQVCVLQHTHTPYQFEVHKTFQL